MSPIKTTFSGPATSSDKPADQEVQEFLATAKAAGERFFNRPQSEKDAKTPLTPLQRRMQSGGI